MQRVVHQGRETVFEATGTGGPRLLYVHGSGADRRLWNHQRASIGGVALDLSGHGNSDDIDADPGFETLSAYADDVLAVAAETDSQVLVGNSLGGAVCLHLLLERADEHDFEGCVLAGSGAKLGVIAALRDWLADDFERAITFLHEPDTLFHDPETLRETPGDPVGESEATMNATGRAVTERDFLTCHRFDVRDRLEGISLPTLALCGEHDRLTPPRFHEFLADRIPDAELEVLPAAAHLAMVERPDRFNAAVEGFLDRHVA